MFDLSGRPWLHTGIKLVIIGLLGWALYVQVFATNSVALLREAFLSRLEDPEWGYAVWAVVLMPVNWLLETFKWQTLLRPEVRLSSGQALRAVLGGVAVSLFMPNRTGEYAGRLLLTDASSNWRVVQATLMGSMAQLIVITGCGLLGIDTFVRLVAEWQLHGLDQVWVLGVMAWLLLLLLYFNIRYVGVVLRFVLLWKRMERYLAPLLTHRAQTPYRLGIALLFAFSRYMVYVVQYLLILAFFGIHPVWWQGVSGITTVFLLQTGIPLPPFGALLARSEIALLVWSVFAANEVSILAATFALFILNLGLPALFGAVFIFRTNVLKSVGYDKTPGKE